MTMLTRSVRQYIAQYKLLSRGNTVIVTLSGGSDSVALLCVLHHLGYDCVAAHCNFSLRGEESDRDEAFVRRHCEKKEIPLRVIRFDTRAYASEHHLSIEMAARTLRYEWFEALRAEYAAQDIAVAHHRDDSVETVLLNLIRGTGIHGLCGIRPRNGYIVRPLLCVSRQDILDYLSHIGETYVTDSTNLEDAFTRNKIRLRLLPLMEEINPSVKESIQRTASYLDQAAVIYDRAIDEGKNRVTTEGGISISLLLREPSPLALLYEVMRPLGFNSAQVNDLFESLEGQSGKVFSSATHYACKDRDRILIREINEDDEAPFTLLYKKCTYTSDYVIPRSATEVCFDADKLDGQLTLRRWKTGDRFVPFGMKGSKLISDFLTDQKIPLCDKENQWLLCCGEEIIWVLGRRTDNRYRITPTTKTVMQITMIEKVKK